MASTVREDKSTGKAAMLANNELLDDVVSKAREMAGAKGELGFDRSEAELALQAVYYASIRREEGEVVRPHLALMSSETFEHLGTHAALLISDDPQRLTPELLRKRSLAFDRRSTSFLATPSEDGLLLRGVAHWSWNGESTERRATGLPLLRFDAEEAGTVVIAYDQTRLGLLRDGSFYPSRPNVFLSAAFKKALASTLDRLQSKDDRLLAFRSSLHFLVRSAMSRGLGATIVVIDDWLPVNISEYIESGEAVSYTLRKTPAGNISLGVRQDVLDSESVQTDLRHLTPARKAYLEFIAQLACVDGALLIGPKFNPIRYGTKLRAPACDFPVYLGGDSEHEIPSVLQGVGTRHSSALNFVAHIKKAVAITISSDGPVSAFAWLDGRLSWWKNAVEP